MGKALAIAVAFWVACLSASCSQVADGATVLPNSTSGPTERLQTATLALGTVIPTPVCPPAMGEGTVGPAISIYSITFLVNGAEQTLLNGGTLQASPGDEVEVREVTICAGPFSTEGGEACVDFAPGDPSGREITAEHAGTHLVPVTPGFMTIAGPSRTWTVSASWTGISVVVNHWPPVDTEDRGCGDGHCEHDDWLFVRFR